MGIFFQHLIRKETINKLKKYVSYSFTVKDVFYTALLDHLNPSFRRLNVPHLDSRQCVIQFLNGRTHLSIPLGKQISFP